MAKKSRTILIAGGVVAVLVVVTIVQLKMQSVQVIDVEGTITWIDAKERKGSLEFESPRKKGKITEKVCTIPPECELTLNGKPATIEDIKVNDKAAVKIRWDIKKKELTPLKIAVNRPNEQAKSASNTPRTQE